jgi:L-rhamnose-H+ transport protein
MQVIFGVIFHFIGGFASGSFYMPFKKVKKWSWESLWIIGGLFSWLIIPPVAAWLTIPHFTQIIHNASASALGYTFLFGLLWGIGGLTYGLGVRYLGVALGSSIILGLCMVFGSLIPSIYYQINPTAGKDTISDISSHAWGIYVLAGLLICIVGIILCGKAGMMKEKEMQLESEPVSFHAEKRPVGHLETAAVAEEAAIAGIGYRHEAYDEIATEPSKTVSSSQSNAIEYKFALGLTVAIISGILSACFNFGLEAGSSMASVANDAWKAAHSGAGEFLYRNNVVYVVLLWGGLTTNLVWCIILNARNKTFGDYTNKKAPLLTNYIFSALAGTTWFLQFFFYGMGESRLGNGASSWILHMSFIILVANMWGLISKEWKGVSKKTRGVLFIGVATIIAAVLIVGYGNYLKP